MPQYTWPDCPEDVRRQVGSLTNGLCRILADNLIGIYLHGSLAIGGFNPQRSDVDLLVVARRGMRVQTKREVAGLLLRCSNDPRPIEISFLSQAQLRPWRHPAPFDFHFGEDWREELEAQMADGRWLAWNSEGLILSKDEGGAWALAGLPSEFHPTIAVALDIYRGEAEPGALRAEYVAPFAAHVTNRAGARPAPTA